MNKQNIVLALAMGMSEGAFGGTGATTSTGMVTPTVTSTKASAEEHRELIARLGMVAGGEAVEADRKAADELVKRLVDQSVAAHPALAVETARLKATDAGVQAAQALYQPVVSLSASGARNAQRELGAKGTSSTTTRTAGLTLRENVWRGGQDALAIEIAGEERNVQQATRDAREAELRFQAESALLAYNEAAMRANLAKVSAVDAAGLTRISERKFNAGQVGKIDVHGARRRESEARAQVVAAELARSEAWFSALRALGVAPTAAPQEKDTEALSRAALPFPPAPPVLPTLPAATLDERSAAATATKAERTLAKAHRARYLPEVDVVASAERNQTDRALDDAASPTGRAASSGAKTIDTRLGVELRWPLWDRPRDAAVARAAAEAEAARAGVGLAQNAALVTATALRKRTADLYAALPPYREAYEQAENLYASQLKLYDAGAVDLASVNEADGQRIVALRSWYDATQEIKVALLKWAALQRGFVP